MSDYYPPSSPGQATYEQTQALPSQESDSTSMTDKATDVKDKAAEAANEGKQAAGQVAQTAVEHAQEVKDEAVRQARDLAGEARQQVSSQVGQQHQALVSNLRSLGSELGSMTQSADGQSGVATELVSQAKDRIDGLANWLDGREPGQLLDEARDYARRRPGMFLLGALAAGVVAGRLTRGAVAAHTSDEGELGGAPRASELSYAEAPAASGYSTGGQYGQYGQPGYPAVPESTQGYGSTSTYGDNAGNQHGAPAYGQPQQGQPTQDMPNGGTWR
jgi:vacuolar-type H+-ATPase subunit H